MTKPSTSPTNYTFLLKCLGVLTMAMAAAAAYFALTAPKQVGFMASVMVTNWNFVIAASVGLTALSLIGIILIGSYIRNNGFNFTFYSSSSYPSTPRFFGGYNSSTSSHSHGHISQHPPAVNPYSFSASNQHHHHTHSSPATTSYNHKMHQHSDDSSTHHGHGHG